MPPEQAAAGTYFDTPARAERLQLLLHLVRNAGEVIYLRAPSGAGKTAFAHRLLDEIADEMATVWLHAGQVDDVPAAAADQLGLDANQAEPWPDAVFDALSGQELLLVVDDADQLELAVFEQLAEMHARGGRLLLMGRGGLAQATGNWDVQFIDLPPFEREQTAVFLRGWAGDDAERITDDMAAALHRAARGLPGPLLEALNEVLAPTSVRKTGAASPASVVPQTRRPLLLPWAAGAAVLGLLIAALAFQDQINALFEPTAGMPQDNLPTDAGVADPKGLIERPAVFDMTSPPVTPADPEPAAVAGVPLPESGPGGADSIAMPALPPVSEGESTASSPIDTELVPQAPEPAGLDPLEAVMRDAISAAEAVRPPAAAVAEPVSTPKLGLAPEPELKPEPAQTSANAPSPPAVTASVVPTPPLATTGIAPGKPPSVSPQPKTQPVPAAPVPVVVEAGPLTRGDAAVIAEKTPAPVEERVAAPLKSGDRPAAASSAAPLSHPPAPVKQPRTAANEGADWLTGRDPARYTLQLVGARDRAAIEKFIRDNAVAAPYAVFERMLNGAPWYSLVAGDYPDRAAAIAARERLPKRLERSGVWPRTFESIKKAM